MTHWIFSGDRKQAAGRMNTQICQITATPHSHISTEDKYRKTMTIEMDWPGTNINFHSQKWMRIAEEIKTDADLILCKPTRMSFRLFVMTFFYAIFFMCSFCVSIIYYQLQIYIYIFCIFFFFYSFLFCVLIRSHICTLLMYFMIKYVFLTWPQICVKYVA